MVNQLSREQRDMSHLIAKELVPRGVDNMPKYTLYFHISFGRVSGTSARFGSFKNQHLVQRFGFNVYKEKYREFKKIWESNLPVNQRFSQLLSEKIIYKRPLSSSTHIDYDQSKIDKIYEEIQKDYREKIYSQDVTEIKQLREKVNMLLEDIDKLISTE